MDCIAASRVLVVSYSSSRRPTSVSLPAGWVPSRSTRRCASCTKVCSSSICLLSSSRWWNRASVSSGSESGLARLKAVIFPSAFASSPRISASFWVMMSRVRVTCPART